AWVDEARAFAPMTRTVSRAADDLASLIYTSGTTGRSKGAMLSHGSLAANALALHEAWGFTPDDVLLHALPIFHVHGRFVALHGESIGGSVGYPLPGVDLRIGGGEETGVIEIKGPSVFSAYWRMPEKTAEEFTSDGYFITGDVGRRDPDGRVWISGRAKDLIISGGYNVYPKEVELVLDELPGVTESAVIGCPHPDFGEGVVAVVMGQGLTASDEAAMIVQARAQ